MRRGLGVMLVACFVQLAGTSRGLAAQAGQGLPPIVRTVAIDASPEEVWQAVVDFDNYGSWNDWVVRIEGTAALDSTVKAFASSGQSLDLQITRLEEPYQICWVDVSWFTRLNVGGWRCRFIVSNPTGPGVLFVNHFEYTGAFGWVLRGLTREALENGMELENRNLKDYVEGTR